VGLSFPYSARPVLRRLYQQSRPQGVGRVAPAGTPAPIINKLNVLTVTVLKMPDVIARMKLQGLHAMSSTPAEFATLIASEVDHWAKVIPSIGIQPE
jgi:tripartite-type tricarboxylate transporter receptor subunit TctC